MSNCDELVEEKINNTIFMSSFPEPLADGKINTWEFLIASKGVVTLLERFGKVFIAVISDMNGNILKLTNKYNCNRENYVYLDDMVLSEKGTDVVVAIDALLWLGRGLHFVQRFFELLVQDSASESDILVPILRRAYDETLKDFHGWMAQQLFKLIVRICPTRSQLLRAMCSDDSTSYEETIILSSVSEYSGKLKQNIMVIKDFYKHHDLESCINV